jgi:hypothetical protein
MQATASPITQPTSKFKIVATHQAYGTMEFHLDALDRKDAFNRFKGVVYSAKQWIIVSNDRA